MTKTFTEDHASKDLAFQARGDHKFGTIAETGGGAILVRGVGTKTAIVEVKKDQLGKTQISALCKAFNLAWTTPIREEYRALRMRSAALALASSFGQKTETDKQRKAIFANDGIMDSIRAMTGSFNVATLDDLPSLLAYMAHKGVVSSKGGISERQDVLVGKGYDVETPIRHSTRADASASMNVQLPIPTVWLFAVDPDWTLGDKLKDNKGIKALDALATKLARDADGVLDFVVEDQDGGGVENA